jgi:hypothetical protein
LAVRNLPKHEFVLASGLATGFNPLATAGKYLLQADNMDGFGKFLCLGKVPGSTVRSADHGSPVVSLHQFEYTNLQYVRTREQISLTSAGTLSRINASDKSLTTLTTGLYGEPLREVNMLNHLHLSSPNQRALTTGGIKWDGTQITNWGVNPPGGDITVKHPVQVHTDFVDSGADTTIETNTDAHQDGVSSVQVNKVGTGVAYSYMDDTGLAMDISSAGQDGAFVWLFIPAGALQKMEETPPAVEIRYGNAGLGNSDKHYFGVGELFPGWNLLSMVTSAPDATSGSGATLSNIDTLRLTLHFKNASQLQSGFLWNKFYITDEGACTATDNSNSGFTAGTYSYRVTYTTEYGVESNAGPSSDPVTTEGTAASRILDFAGTPNDGGTVTIDGKTYIYQTVLTNEDGNVLIGASATTARNNLVAAINKAGQAGTDYAAKTTVHPTVTASTSGADLKATAKTAGTAGNSIVVLEDATNISWPSGTLTGGGDGEAVDLTNLPISSDPQVLGRRIYRDISGDEIYRFVGAIDDNVTTTFQDTLADASLGTANPPIAGDVTSDNTPPGRLSAITTHMNRVVGVAADDEFTLIVSEIASPETARIDDQLQLEERIVAMASHQYGTLIYGTDKVFLLTGDGVSYPMRVDEITNQVGCNGFRAVARVKGFNFILREKEFYLLAHRIVFFAQSAGGDYDTILVYQYGTTGASQVSASANVDPHDLSARPSSSAPPTCPSYGLAATTGTCTGSRIPP